MTETSSRSQIVGRRGELIAELFLEELEPEFVTRPSADLGYDLFVGFQNPRGGTNVIAVEVKSTEKVVRDHYPVSRKLYDRWANSNLPVLLLIVNVKENKLFYHWPSPDVARESKGSITISIHLTEIDEDNKEKLRDQLAG